MFLFYFVRNPFVLPAIYIYIKILAEGPGVARGKKQNKKNKKMLKKKISAHLVQPFGRLYATYLYTNVLFYYIDKDIYFCIWAKGFSM